jgi:hypothetical protein
MLQFCLYEIYTNAAVSIVSNLYAEIARFWPAPGRLAMADLIYIGAGLAFFALALLYVTTCEHL